MSARQITVEQRRRALARRHHHAGGAADTGAVVASLVALHATDPGSVYLSVLARCASATLGDVAAEMYETRTLVRWMAMRRTLFLFARDDVPTVQAAVSDDVARSMRTRLLGRLTRNGTDPPIPGDASRWLVAAEADAARALGARGAATGVELAGDVPALATTIRARTASERPQNVTSSLLTLMATEGRLVRGAATGAWTTRQHRWEPAAAWWPDGMPAVDQDAARSWLARRWLERFGPGTPEDLRWWTGWGIGTTRAALASLATEAVDLGDGRQGIALAGSVDSLADDSSGPVAALLPALDPTPMGWKERDWFLPVDRALLFDRAGNVGPTVWWDGEVIGGWAMEASGEIRWRILADRGAEARDAVAASAAALVPRLEGTVVTPYARTPLERELSSAA